MKAVPLNSTKRSARPPRESESLELEAAKDKSTVFSWLLGQPFDEIVGLVDGDHLAAALHGELEGGAGDALAGAACDFAHRQRRLCAR